MNGYRPVHGSSVRERRRIKHIPQRLRMGRQDRTFSVQERDIVEMEQGSETNELSMRVVEGSLRAR